MTKSYAHLVRTESPISFVRDEQKILAKKETPKLERKNKKSISNDTFRQSSQKFMQKIRNITFISISTKHDGQKSNDASIKVSKDVSTALQTLTELEGKPRLKGILKGSGRSISYCGSIDESPCETYQTTDDPKMSDDHTKASLRSNSLKTIKQVRFDDKISRKKYKPNRSLSSVAQLSSDQQSKLKKLHRTDSLTIQSINYKSIILPSSAEFQPSNSSELTDDESSDDDEE